MDKEEGSVVTLDTTDPLKQEPVKNRVFNCITFNRCIIMLLFIIAVPLVAGLWRETVIRIDRGELELAVPTRCRDASCLIKMDGSVCTIRFENSPFEPCLFKGCTKDTRRVPCNYEPGWSCPITECTKPNPHLQRATIDLTLSILLTAVIAMLFCTFCFFSCFDRRCCYDKPRERFE